MKRTGKQDGTGPRPNCPKQNGSGNPNGSGRGRRNQTPFMPGAGKKRNR